MLNGQLKSAYNLQISIQEQFILNYSLHQSSTDYQTLAPHLDQYEALYAQKPEAVVADAGYGADENYKMLKEKCIEAFSNDSLHYNEQGRQPHSRGKP